MADVQLLGGVDIRELAARLDVVPTKKLGQNFVTDPNTIRRIVAAAKLEGTETVVEIGPGLGSLTLGLLEVAAKVLAVEIDPKMAAALEATIAKRAVGKDFTLIHEDALKITELPVNPDALVANLPYNISTPILFYNADLFKAAGLDPQRPPQTWSEVKATTWAVVNLARLFVDKAWV